MSDLWGNQQFLTMQMEIRLSVPSDCLVACNNEELRSHCKRRGVKRWQIQSEFMR